MVGGGAMVAARDDMAKFFQHERRSAGAIWVKPMPDGGLGMRMRCCPRGTGPAWKASIPSRPSVISKLFISISLAGKLLISPNAFLAVHFPSCYSTCVIPTKESSVKRKQKVNYEINWF